MITKIKEILKVINCSCKNNGIFSEQEKVLKIKDTLAGQYLLINQGNQFLLYSHKDFDQTEPFILVSSHIDEEYPEYFLSDFNKKQIIGTFDNSICNAVLIYLIKSGKLPPNVLITFTGREEEDSEGARETMNYIKSIDNLRNNLGLVIVMDVTVDKYYKYPYTIENYFIKNGLFKSRKEFKKYCRRILDDEKIKFVNDDKAEIDESWEYDEHDLNCFSFCLPAKPHPETEESDDWMHKSEGIIIKEKSVWKYTKSLLKIITSVSKDLKKGKL
ncbi:MAG: hypothetical protein N2510_07340 [Ignavibacteria bacterium]|nr:hypothetical protein [Ignavibacteria bacterium]